jgi:hypothetical protein
MIYLKLLGVIALLGSIAWTVLDPGFEPALAIVASMSALASAYIVEHRKARLTKQHQSVSKSSVGVQAGRDVRMESTGRDTHAE